MCGAAIGRAARRRDGGGGAGGGAGERRLLGPAGDQEAAVECGGAESRARAAAQREVVSAAGGGVGGAGAEGGTAANGPLSPQGLRAGLCLGPAAAERAAAAPGAHRGTARRGAGWGGPGPRCARAAGGGELGGGARRVVLRRGCCGPVRNYGAKNKIAIGLGTGAGGCRECRAFCSAVEVPSALCLTGRTELSQRESLHLTHCCALNEVL